MVWGKGFQNKGAGTLGKDVRKLNGGLRSGEAPLKGGRDKGKKKVQGKKKRSMTLEGGGGGKGYIATLYNRRGKCSLNCDKFGIV